MYLIDVAAFNPNRLALDDGLLDDCRLLDDWLLDDHRLLHDHRLLNNRRLLYNDSRATVDDCACDRPTDHTADKSRPEIATAVPVVRTIPAMRTANVLMILFMSHPQLSVFVFPQRLRSNVRRTYPFSRLQRVRDMSQLGKSAPIGLLRRTGTRRRPAQAEMSPQPAVMPRALQAAAPAPDAKTSGSSPTAVASKATTDGEEPDAEYRSAVRTNPEAVTGEMPV